jgi:alpha-L-fucosidase
MSIRPTRRTALQVLSAGLAPWRSAFGAKAVFEPTWESLKQYRCPEWFRDAKFGIWAHWGPQGAPMEGDWYARNIYVQGSRHYEYHLKTYGHPSQFGFKDIIPLWTGKNWEPEALMRMYKRAGARYFAALGVHCDNFDCWNSKHHRWNAVNHGPKRDVVGTWGKVAREHGLRFAVSEHLAWSYDWFNVNKGADKSGPFAGVPYDGNNPEYQDLYWEPHPESGANFPVNPSRRFLWSWFARIKDLIDQQKPDLVYTDGGLFGQMGRDMVAYYYNANMSWNGGEQQGVYTLKQASPDGINGEYQPGAGTRDMERAVPDEILADPFQMDTCLGQWQYYRDFKYRSAKELVHTLVDVVSKNGSMLLSVPQMPDGTLDSEEESILHDITMWMRINSEAIYDTRPWKKFGDGPSIPAKHQIANPRGPGKPLSPEDIRYTAKGGKLYVFCMGPQEKDIELTSLGTAGAAAGQIKNVRLIGSDEKLSWTQEAGRLKIARPAMQPHPFAIVFEVVS